MRAIPMRGQGIRTFFTFAMQRPQANASYFQHCIDVRLLKCSMAAIVCRVESMGRMMVVKVTEVHPNSLRAVKVASSAMQTIANRISIAIIRSDGSGTRANTDPILTIERKHACEEIANSHHFIFKEKQNVKIYLFGFYARNEKSLRLFHFECGRGEDKVCEFN